MHNTCIFLGTFLLITCFGHLLPTQSNPWLTIPLQDRSAFRNPEANWKICGNAYSDLERSEVLQAQAGTGILANLPDGKTRGDLFFNLNKAI